MTYEELDIANAHMSKIIREGDQLIAALRRELAEAKAWVEKFHEATNYAEEQRDAARADAGRWLRECLEPLATWQLYPGEEDRPDEPIAVRGVASRICIKHVLAARAALATPAADITYAPDEVVREVNRRMMDIHRETFQKLAAADASGEVRP